MLEFRPHHFLCTIGFQGKGYSPDFEKNYSQIALILKGERFEEGYRENSLGNTVQIKVVERTDSICGPCPSKRGDLCETQEKIERLDRAHAAVLELKAGDVLSWGEAKAKIAEKFSLEKFDAACETCSWKPMGVCRAALLELKKAHLALP